MSDTTDFETDVSDRLAAEALIVDVDGFEGPLDLLLTMSRTQKVDLRQISVLALAEQYLAFIEKARDLNGVNPVVCIVGSLFALGVAAGLWYATQTLGAFFASHPVESTVYFVQRSSQVVRNISMGLISLASGFFGVTGLGIFMLGVRVAYGVMTGELDPTPIKQNQSEKIDMPNVWDLMLNKKPGRRGGGSNDNNPFGI